MAIPDEVKNDPEFAEIVQAAVEKSLSTEHAGLVAKNQALIAELREVKDRYQGIDVDQAKAAAEALRKAEQDKLKEAGEFEAALAKEREHYATETSALKEARDKAAAELRRLRIGQALDSGLLGIGVRDADLLAAAKALHSGAVDVTEDGAVMLDGKPVEEALKAWGGTDSGKKFISAPANGGGGAHNSGSDGAGDPSGIEVDFVEGPSRNYTKITGHLNNPETRERALLLAKKHAIPGFTE